MSVFRMQAFVNSTDQLYASPFFKAEGQAHSQFLQAIAPYLDGRSVDFENMVRYFSHAHVTPTLTNTS